MKKIGESELMDRFDKVVGDLKTFALPLLHSLARLRSIRSASLQKRTLLQRTMSQNCWMDYLRPSILLAWGQSFRS